ncbi:MAG: L-rhamnose mutarotase [Bacteroidota bacterium]
MNHKYVLTLDLKDDAQLIAQYEAYHKNVWPEIIASIKDSGIIAMEIYRISNRLMMIMEVNNEFSFEKKQEMDNKNTNVQKWEELMWNYQQALPFAAADEKWVLMEKIFELK